MLPPSRCTDWIYISDRAYNKEDLLRMESNILATLDFRQAARSDRDSPAAGRLAACGAPGARQPCVRGPCVRPKGGATRRRAVGKERPVLTRSRTPFPC